MPFVMAKGMLLSFVLIFKSAPILCVSHSLSLCLFLQMARLQAETAAAEELRRRLEAEAAATRAAADKVQARTFSNHTLRLLYIYIYIFVLCFHIVKSDFINQESRSRRMRRRQPQKPQKPKRCLLTRPPNPWSRKGHWRATTVAVHRCRLRLPLRRQSPRPRTRTCPTSSLLHPPNRKRQPQRSPRFKLLLFFFNIVIFVLQSQVDRILFLNVLITLNNVLLFVRLQHKVLKKSRKNNAVFNKRQPRVKLKSLGRVRPLLSREQRNVAEAVLVAVIDALSFHWFRW